MQRDWVVSVSVRVNADRSDRYRDLPSPAGRPAAREPDIRPFPFETMGFVFPVVPETASSRAPELPTGELRVDDRIVDDSPQEMHGQYHSGVMLFRWDGNESGTPREAREVSLQMKVLQTCFRTVFDETSALRVPWPKGPWPTAAASTLGTQLYVDIGIDEKGKPVKYADDKILDQYLKSVYSDEGVRDATQLTPVSLAKAITRKIWADIQPSGDGLTNQPRTGELSGIALQSPGKTLESGRGSEHDLTCVMAALFRRAGLPTRTVIGYDVSGDNNKFLSGNRKANRLRSWVEFCLYDEDRNTINWVPVDVMRLRKTSSRPPSGERAWKYFGTHDELDSVAPIALHFTPPTDVVSYGSPGFWGWFVTPKPPEQALQAIAFRAETAPKRGDDGDEDKKKEDKKRTLPRR